MVSDAARERVVHILKNRENRPENEVLEMLRKEPEWPALALEVAQDLGLMPDHYEDVAGQLGISARMLSITGNRIRVMITPKEFTATHCDLNQFGEGTDVASALRHLVSSCREYVDYLFERKGAGQLGENLEHGVYFVEEQGGPDVWLSAFTAGVEDWIKNNPDFK